MIVLAKRVDFWGWLALNALEDFLAEYGSSYVSSTKLDWKSLIKKIITFWAIGEIQLSGATIQSKIKMC